MKRGRVYGDYLRDILEAAEKAEEFLGERDLAAFIADEKTNFAVVRALEIIGEASKRIPPRIRQRHPDVPWREMSGMRDKLAHEYFGVDLRRAHETVRRDIPALKALLRHVLEEEQKRE
jgi:uncharacterized protein with HEPN domain